MKRQRFKFRVEIGKFLVLLMFCCTALAGSVSKKYTFAPGETISSSKINSNFDALYAELNAKDARIAALEAAAAANPFSDYLSVASAVKNPASGAYLNMTGNGFNLTPGTWMLFGSCTFGLTGNADYSQNLCGWYNANGADNGTEPSYLSTNANLTVQADTSAEGDASGPNLGRYVSVEQIGNITDRHYLTAPTLRIVVTANTTIYLVPMTYLNAPGSSKIWVRGYAQRIK